MTTQGDVYSFGVLLLEIFTGKRPTESSFEDGLNLNQFVKMALPDGAMEIVDCELVFGEDEERTKSSNTLFQIRRENTPVFSFYTQSWSPVFGVLTKEKDKNQRCS